MARVRRDALIERERQAWELSARGVNQFEIARRLGITQSGVSKLLSRVARRMLKQLNADVEAMKLERTMQLEHVLEESLEGWARSQRDAVEVSKRALPGGGVITTRTQSQRDGDVAFLEQARLAVREICLIWGLHAPRKVEVVGTVRHQHQRQEPRQAFDFDRLLSSDQGGQN